MGCCKSKVPVPNVYANFVDPQTQKRYIVMDFIPDTDMQRLLPSLTPTEKNTASERIKEVINELRAIPPPDYLGNLNGTFYIDGVLSTPDKNRVISGPLRDQEEMDHSVLERLSQAQLPHFIRLLKAKVKYTPKNHRAHFTHEDLLPKNIIVGRIARCEKEADFKVSLIDWNMSGWYPKFWEFAIRRCVVN
ncbi:hypothetical protein N7457_002433 [Penicillium paradoxum]|uniref:uncharacterized protein n=1 Tax=Penicillium paradoxum TaxID=176176 RepID=UPI002548189E|nr:uncharacterized protein N7457_002433 [Penicillium paradoxum]KAJ5787443.1 hypothetical protein N7457_002433 [Penicillium paradoxum]